MTARNPRIRFTMAQREEFNRKLVELCRDRGGDFMAPRNRAGWKYSIAGWRFETIAGEVVVWPLGLFVRIRFKDFDAMTLAAEQLRFATKGLIPRLKRLDFNEWTESTPVDHRVQLFAEWLDRLLSHGK